MTRAQRIFHARAPGGEPDEGLELVLVGGGQVAVRIRLGGRTQSVTLDRFDAIDLAACVRARLARRRRALHLIAEPTGGTA